YEPASFERRWYAMWESEGYFTPDPDQTETPAFSIVIPPPNVTGRLHTGHALVNTLQDILVRWKRMSGFNTLWMPGTDHAGIATQMVVERELAKEGLSRIEMGREEFLRRVWAWKEDHKGQIKEQLVRLGVSCDWTRERFTLDEGLSRAVRHVFVTLFKEDLIYRALAMTNWCPRCRTAISDIEVEHREQSGKIYMIEYPMAVEGTSLIVATTRPETMLGDTAVAVQPEDPRYSHLIGGMVTLPLTGRTIPVIGDAILVDPEFGTGVVKITPAHDRNDYEAGVRNGLSQIQVIGEDGRMTAAAGDQFAGLDRFEARERVLEELEAAGLLRETKEHVNAVALCGKCDTIIEPMISRQWFVRIAPLAGPAIEVVRDGRVTITPQSWESTYFNWMENIHDWCISRQLWWGHRIPAFYCNCGEVVVSEEDSPSCPKCGSSDLSQDPDVLDTWFSSSLWPFSTMGWPDETRDLKLFYPTDTLVTGFDILFFWVARMIMMGIRFTGQPPFSKVFLNGLVRDEFGQKMSKSKGNVIDPMDAVDEMGADPVRFTLAILTSGRDIPLAKSRMQGYAAFANKIWNASRFSMMHIDTELRSAKPINRDELRMVERWILSRVNAATHEVNRALSNFRFDEAANAVYKFFWHEFCDWYIEMAKPVLLGKHGTEADQRRARRVLLEALDRSLRLLHPFMPFITEELWQKLGGVEPSIMIAPYPISEDVLDDPEAERLVTIVQEMITTVRNVRVERGFTHSDRFRLVIQADRSRDAAFYEANAYLLVELARLSEVVINGKASGDAHRDVVGGVPIAIEFPEKVLTEEQLARISRDIEGLEKELAGIEARLSNEQFIERAPAAVVDGARSRKEEILSRLKTLRQNLVVRTA
ncbi:MAG TPA: valine--tRNA ligase, partial [Thermoanaerobaculia bacterium]|nr:valine--tRNA ligase [Thermoanaerobaculia bacterium]